MKQYINNFTTDDWRDVVVGHLLMIKYSVNGYAQTKSFIIINKDFCTQELTQRYEQYVP